MEYAAGLSRASRSNERSDRRLRRELSRTSTQPFDPEQSRGAQGHESLEHPQDREPVERPVEWPFDFAQGRELVERQMTSRWWIRAYYYIR
jgi:hypothetical protein